MDRFEHAERTRTVALMAAILTSAEPEMYSHDGAADLACRLYAAVEDAAASLGPAPATADDLFQSLAALASARDIEEHGPNPPDVWRSLHATTLTMAEILEARARLQRPTADGPAIASADSTASLLEETE